MLWTILPVTLALIVVQEMTPRMGVVTGKGLRPDPRGVRPAHDDPVMMLLLVIVNYGNVVSEFRALRDRCNCFTSVNTDVADLRGDCVGCWW